MTIKKTVWGHSRVVAYINSVVETVCTRPTQAEADQNPSMEIIGDLKL